MPDRAGGLVARVRRRPRRVGRGPCRGGSSCGGCCGPDQTSIAIGLAACPSRIGDRPLGRAVEQRHVSLPAWSAGLNQRTPCCQPPRAREFAEFVDCGWLLHAPTSSRVDTHLACSWDQASIRSASRAAVRRVRVRPGVRQEGTGSSGTSSSVTGSADEALDDDDHPAESGHNGGVEAQVARREWPRPSTTAGPSRLLNRRWLSALLRSYQRIWSRDAERRRPGSAILPDRPRIAPAWR